ncbi:helix-turn-helix transcriptional regulator [Nocardioides nitrophenolicus]|uniref:helix-turn-helix transcriptional regulator n=1 Tax=Nocardioides nitrophenolicus TaxID=60489 RepID=UPI00195B697C|nr:AraC family transcriptional regulator [Nocardioides nitrophenolicus]MBM7518701.1 AraC-like DNA-binding protein [Nocardioides nitrophenolicus]
MTATSRHVVTEIDEWVSRCSSAYVPLRVDVAKPAFRGAIRERSIGDLSVCQVAATSSVVSRTAAHASADPRESLMFTGALAGTTVVVQNGRVSELGAGGFYLIASDLPYGLRIPRHNDLASLRIPVSALQLRPDELGVLGGATLHGGVEQARILVCRIRELAAAPAPATAEDERVTVELARAVLHVLRYGETSHPVLSGPAILASARWFIDTHHARASLTIDEVAQRFVVSRRHLESQFARTDTTPAAYLREARLRHACDLLSQEPSTSVTAIAARAGFSDVNTFIRSFRREHGATPAQWRRDDRTQEQDPGLAATG